MTLSCAKIQHHKDDTHFSQKQVAQAFNIPLCGQWSKCVKLTIKILTTVAVVTTVHMEATLPLVQMATSDFLWYVATNIAVIWQSHQYG